MRLTDEQVAAWRDDMKPGFYIPPWDIPLPATIHALATEVLESRAEIAAKDAEIDELCTAGSDLANDFARLVAELAACKAVLFDQGPPDHQAEVLRLHREKCDMLDRAFAAEARVAELTTLLDQQMGTPCEQIRHRQEIENLRALVLEEAAKVALGEMYGFATDQLTEHGVGYERACKDIATTIRAMKGTSHE